LKSALSRERFECPVDLGLLVAHPVALEERGRLHGAKRQKLHHVVLEHVPEHPCLVVVAGAVADADRFRRADEDRTDVLPVPDRLEDRVGEAQHDHVLDRLLGQVVIDAENLMLLEAVVQGRIQAPGRGKVVAEGLLHHHAHPAEPAPALARQAGGAQARGDGLVGRGRHGQVDQQVAAGLVLGVERFQDLGQLLERLRVLEIHALIEDACGELLETRQVAPFPFQALAQMVAEGRSAQFGPAGADDEAGLGQAAVDEEREEGRKELARGQVPGGPEDEDDAGLGDAVETAGRAFVQKLRGFLAGHGRLVGFLAHGSFLWPPRPFREQSSPRSGLCIELRRTYSRGP